MQIIVNGIIVGGLYALLAIGFNLIYSTVRFFRLEYGAIALFGSYFTWYLQDKISLHFIPAALIATIITSLIGLAVWILIYKPLRKRGSSDLVMLVASFGLLLVIQNIISLIFKNNIRSISFSDTIQAGHEIFGLIITSNQTIILITTIIIVLIMSLILKKTRTGLMIRSIGENAELAKTSGVPTKKVTYLVFLIGTALSSIASILVSLEIGMRPQYAMIFILKAVIASIIGGIGSPTGALFGGLILGIAENVGTFYFGSSWQESIAFVLLTIFLLFRPQGLIAANKRLS